MESSAAIFFYWFCDKSVTSKKKSCVYFLTNFSVDLNEILYVVTTSLFVEVRAKFIWHDQYVRERTLPK